MQVKGRLSDLEGGVRTRSQLAAAAAARRQGGGGEEGPSHTMVSCNLKILMVLAELLADLKVRTCGVDRSIHVLCIGSMWTRSCARLE